MMVEFDSDEKTGLLTSSKFDDVEYKTLRVHSHKTPAGLSATDKVTLSWTNLNVFAMPDDKKCFRKTSENDMPKLILQDRKCFYH